MNYLRNFGSDDNGGAGINVLLLIFLVVFSFCAILSGINGYEMKPLKAAWNMFQPQVEQGMVNLSKMKKEMVGDVEDKS